MRNARITIFDNHKIPRKYRKHHKDFFIKYDASQNYVLKKGFGFASSDVSSDNYSILVYISSLIIPSVDKRWGVRYQCFRIYLKEKDFKIQFQNSYSIKTV